MAIGITPVQQEAALLKKNYLEMTGLKMDNYEALQQAKQNLSKAKEISAVFDKKDILEEARTLQKNYFKNTGVDLSPKEALEQARKAITTRNELADVFVKSTPTTQATKKVAEQVAENIGKKAGDAATDVIKKGGDAATDVIKKAGDAATDVIKKADTKSLTDTLKDASKKMPTWGKVACGIGIAALALFGINKASQPKELPQQQQTLYA